MMKRHDRSRFSIYLLLVSVLVATWGCGGGREDQWTQARPPVYPVSGQVLSNGEPVAQATVMFQPVSEGGKPGFATTDGRGNFRAQTFETGDGLTEGTHRVAIHKTHMVDQSGNIVEEVMDDGIGLTEKNLLPEIYADFATSGIEVTVEAVRSNQLEPFDLSQ